MYMVTPILFESGWIFVPSLLTIIVTVVRTALEDQPLQEKLPGFQAYTQKVRYHLFPGLW